MDEIEIRKQAISRYENGESCKQIYQSLGKSKKWFFKWLKRYKHDGITRQENCPESPIMVKTK